MIIYNISTGVIMTVLSESQSLDTFYFHETQEYREKLATLELDNPPMDIFNYRVINNVLVKVPEDELIEIQRYGKVLSEDERTINKLKPTHEEVKKAETTIEILSVLQGVL